LTRALPATNPSLRLRPLVHRDRYAADSSCARCAQYGPDAGDGGVAGEAAHVTSFPARGPGTEARGPWAQHEADRGRARHQSEHGELASQTGAGASDRGLVSEPRSELAHDVDDRADTRFRRAPVHDGRSKGHQTAVACRSDIDAPFSKELGAQTRVEASSSSATPRA